MTKQKYLWSLTAGAVLALGSYTACSRPAKTQASTETEEPVRVAVAKVSRGDLAQDLVLTAEFRPYQEVDVMAKVSGYVKQINVDIGDRVKEGQLLATLEIPEMADDLTRAAASLKRNDAELERAKEELKRSNSSHEIAHLTAGRLDGVLKTRPGLVAQQEIDDAHSRDMVSEAQVAVSKSALAAAEEQVNVAQAEQARTKTLYNYTQVTAPFAGVVTKRYADTGSMIQAGTASQTQAMPVIRLSQNSLLRLILPVPESAVPSVHVGQRVEVQVPSLHRSFPGRVVRFADKLQVSTRTMDTEVDVPNPQLFLIPGMYATVNLTIEQRTNALAIPLTAIGGNQENPVVFIVGRNDTIEERPVTLGLETAQRAEVRSGLAEGELVVVGNRNQLQAGQQVSPKVVEMAELQDQPKREGK
jgi:RND family efflux transporter MFP subunit